MSRRAQLNDSVIGVAIRRGGIRKAWKASLFLSMWGITTGELGHDPTMVEFIDHWADSMATAYRNRRAFLDCFPEWTPGDLWAHLNLKVGQGDDVATVVPQVVAAKLVAA